MAAGAHRQVDNTYIVQETRTDRYDALCAELRVLFGFDTSAAEILAVTVSKPFSVDNHDYDCFEIKKWAIK